MRLIFALALAIGASGPLLGADSTTNGPATLDVIVEDSRGRVVDTLDPSDFLVSEQSRPLVIDSVRFVRTGSGSATVVPVSAGALTNESNLGADHVIAIYLDEFHVVPGAAAERARAALIRAISDDLGPTDRLIVLKSLDSLLDIKPVTNRRDAIQKVESFDPRRGDFEPRTSFERNYIAGTPARIETARAQIATSSLEALATELGRLSAARKTLIILSEGFTKNGRRRGDDLLPNLDSVVLAANRAHVSIYPFDPSVDPAAARADGTDDASDVGKQRDALRSLADGTSGRSISAGDIDAGLTRAISDSRGYYELILSKDLAHDGRYHAVDVSLRRSGFMVRARKGYWAPSDSEPLRRAAFAASAIPLGATIARRTSPLIRPWFGITRAPDGQTEISFVWEPAPRVPGDRNPPPALAQVGLSVMTLEGRPVYQGIVLPSTVGSEFGAGGQSRASFISPSGRLVVQMAIEDVTARVVDHDVRDLLVKGFPGPVSMGSPEVMRARSAREFQALAADPNATPVAARQFSRTERLLLRIPVFSADGAPTVSARLVSSFGSAMRDLIVTPTPSQTNEYQVDVPLAALANGSYVVEWTARTATGEVRDRVPFRVTP